MKQWHGISFWLVMAVRSLNPAENEQESGNRGSGRCSLQGRCHATDGSGSIANRLDLGCGDCATDSCGNRRVGSGLQVFHGLIQLGQGIINSGHTFCLTMGLYLPGLLSRNGMVKSLSDHPDMQVHSQNLVNPLMVGFRMMEFGMFFHGRDYSNHARGSVFNLEQAAR